jgi:hypothetical protein
MRGGAGWRPVQCREREDQTSPAAVRVRLPAATRHRGCSCCRPCCRRQALAGPSEWARHRGRRRENRPGNAASGPLPAPRPGPGRGAARAGRASVAAGFPAARPQAQSARVRRAGARCRPARGQARQGPAGRSRGSDPWPPPLPQRPGGAGPASAGKEPRASGWQPGPGPARPFLAPPSLVTKSPPAWLASQSPALQPRWPGLRQPGAWRRRLRPAHGRQPQRRTVPFARYLPAREPWEPVLLSVGRQPAARRRIVHRRPAAPKPRRRPALGCLHRGCRALQRPELRCRGIWRPARP